jgi:hypothetical protein
MRTVRLLVVAVFAVLGLVLLSPVLGASVPAKTNTKFCKSVQKITSQVHGSSSASDSAKAKQLAKTTKNAAKSAPNKVKSALNSMASYFQAIGNAGTDRAALAAAIANNTQKYQKAVTTFITYYESNCAVVSTTTT